MVLGINAGNVINSSLLYRPFLKIRMLQLFCETLLLLLNSIPDCLYFLFTALA